MCPPSVVAACMLQSGSVPHSEQLTQAPAYGLHLDWLMTRCGSVPRSETRIATLLWILPTFGVDTSSLSLGRTPLQVFSKFTCKHSGEFEVA